MRQGVECWGIFKNRIKFYVDLQMIFKAQKNLKPPKNIEKFKNMDFFNFSKKLPFLASKPH
jgi:hypothetical protein